MNAKRLVAQLIPSLSYICIVNRGNAAPKMYLSNPLAATALALVMAWYVSTKYIATAVTIVRIEQFLKLNKYGIISNWDSQMKMHKLPHANGTPETTGLAQLISFCAVHANQNNEIGSKKDPIIAGYSRCSGATRPSFFSAWLFRTWGWYKYLSQIQQVTTASRHPTPIPKKTNPDSSVLKW